MSPGWSQDIGWKFLLCEPFMSQPLQPLLQTSLKHHKPTLSTSAVPRRKSYHGHSYLSTFSKVPLLWLQPSCFCSEGEKSFLLQILPEQQNGPAGLSAEAQPLPLHHTLLLTCLTLQETRAPRQPHWYLVQAYYLYHIKGTKICPEQMKANWGKRYLVFFAKIAKVTWNCIAPPKHCFPPQAKIMVKLSDHGGRWLEELVIIT